jgi:hypothetical protein
VIVERPSAAMSLRVEYGEAEVTDVVDDSAFATGGEAAP